MIHVLAKTIWGDLFSINCRDDDLEVEIATRIHEQYTEEFPIIPLIKRETSGFLHDGEILCIIPYPNVDVDISLLSEAVYGNFTQHHTNPDGSAPMGKYKLYEATIHVNHQTFYFPFLVFTFDPIQGCDRGRTIYQPFLPSFHPFNRPALALLQSMAEHNPAFHVNEADFEEIPIHIDGEAIQTTDPWFQFYPLHFQEIDTLLPRLISHCCEGVVEERAYFEAYLTEILSEKLDELDLY